MTATDVNAAICWLKATWESMAVYRRAIPDEQIGTLLLWEIQGAHMTWVLVNAEERT